MEIKSKREFFTKWNQLLLGNKPRTYSSFKEAFLSEWGYFSLREIKAGGGAFQIYHRVELKAACSEWDFLGRKYSIEEVVPGHLALLQGEVMRGTSGWEGYIGMAHGLLMRESKAQGYIKSARGLKVILACRTYMDPSSFDDMMDLFELYPDAVIEFTTYKQDVGIIPNRNTIFWEVRNY